MAASPANIVRRMGANGNKHTYKEILHAFLCAGYGTTKAEKWFNIYMAQEILNADGVDDNGRELYGCIWWI